jgi:hypothetical protein
MVEDAPLKMFNESAIRAAELRRDPYDYAFIDKAIDESLKREALADAPKIPYGGSYAPHSLRYGKKFAWCIEDLSSIRFRRLVEHKFDIDLSSKPPLIVMTGAASGRFNEGYAHPNSKHKLITVIVGFSEHWPHAHGRLRVLRSNDRDDYSFEFPPEFGKMLMFRVCDHSWLGFLPQEGERLSIQLSYVDSQCYVARENLRHGISACAKSIPGLRQAIFMAPRFFGGSG